MCPSLWSDSAFYVLSTGTKMLWTKMDAFVCEETMSILLFSPWFYNIGELCCILGTHQLFSTMFFIKASRAEVITWYLSSLDGLNRLSGYKRYPKQNFHLRKHGKQIVAPNLFIFKRCIQECTSNATSATQALLLIISFWIFVHLNAIG